MRVVLGGSPGRHPRPSALRAIHQTFGTVSQVSVSLTDPCLLPGRWYVDGGGWTNCESAPLDQHGRPSVRHIVLARGHQRFGGLGALGGLQVGATVSAGAGPRVGRGGGISAFAKPSCFCCGLAWERARLSISGAAPLLPWAMEVHSSTVIFMGPCAVSLLKEGGFRPPQNEIAALPLRMGGLGVVRLGSTVENKRM